jgi:hypothetical protein
MTKDLTVILENRPGELARVGEILGKAGVNIEGLSGMIVAGQGMIHILVDDGVKVRRALGDNHIQVLEEHDVIIIPVEDRPGILGNITRRLANAGINIHLAYLATSTRLVIGVDNLEKAREVVQPKKQA